MILVNLLVILMALCVLITLFLGASILAASAVIIWRKVFYR